MLGKWPRPVIGKLSELLTSGNRAGSLGFSMTGPTSQPIELKKQAHRGSTTKNYNDFGGVGLGIVVAPSSSVDNSCSRPGCEVLEKHAVYSSGSERSPLHFRESNEGVRVFPRSEFLSSCHLCMKELDGKDIYMYRGEKGFCSKECRSRHIMIDERRKVISGSKESSSLDVSDSSYNRTQIFSISILAG